MGPSSSSSPSSSSPSSSIDSSENPPSPNSPPPSASASASICRSSNFSSRAARRTRRDSSTDLRLSLSISSSTDQVLVLQNIVSPQGENQCWPDWPPIKPLLRSALAGRSTELGHAPASLFVKVYMEGVPIGRKLDLLSHDGYGDLSERLAHMFKTPILCPNGNGAHSDSDKHYVLTYEDREGDWMMVGDVPWEIFTSTVKRLKITRADRC